MRLFAWLERLPRRVGHTSAAAGVPDREGHERILVCPSAVQANHAFRQHGVSAVALRSAAVRLAGEQRPVVFDVETVKLIAYTYEKSLDLLHREIAAREEEVRELKRTLGRAQESVRELQRKLPAAAEASS